MKNGAASVCLAELETAFMDGMTRKLDLRAAETEWLKYTLEPSYNKSLVTWLVSWAAKEANYCDHAKAWILTNSSKCQIHEQAISKHPDFEQVVASVLLDKAKTNTLMEYTKFWDYLINYALQVDYHKRSTTKNEVKTAELTPNGNNNGGWGRGGSGGQGAGGGGVQWTPSYAATQIINIPDNVNQTIHPNQWRFLTRDQQDEVRRQRENSDSELNMTAQQSVPAAPVSTTRAVNATSTNVVPTDEATTATTAHVNNTVRGYGSFWSPWPR
jgi:hypothetical protein